MDVDRKPDGSFLPATPSDAILEDVRESVVINGRTFVLSRPAESDRLLDHPAIQSAFAADEYMPYWADLWPGARMLAKQILRESWPRGLHTLELGCGLGLPGIAGLASGLRVTFSDYDAMALQYAADNARANGFTDFQIAQLDWRCPPADLQFPVIVGAGLIYEMRNVEPLVTFIQRVLAPGGICLFTDQDRAPAALFRATLEGAGLRYQSKVVHAGELGGRRVRGTLYRITHPN